MKMLKITISSVLMLLSLVSFSSQAADTSVKASSKMPLDTNAFFTVRPDYRRCVSPICGGWFVNAVNLKKIRCPDGSYKKECYVGTDMIKIPDLTPEQIAQLRQAMSESNVLIQGSITNTVPYGLLVINSAWLSATNQKPEGKFVSVSDNGIRCVTFPCLSFDGHILNRGRVKSLAGYDLSAVHATNEQLAQAQEAVASGEGLPMAGRFVEVTGPAGTAQAIEATQFYLKLVGRVPKICMPTGCSGQICSDSAVITTCEWLPEYACYRTASCAAQDNGDCGWVMDAALIKCLEETAGGGLLQ